MTLQDAGDILPFMATREGPFAIPRRPKLPDLTPFQQGLARVVGGTIAGSVGRAVTENQFPATDHIIADYYSHFLSRSLVTNLITSLGDFVKIAEGSPLGVGITTLGSALILWGLAQIAFTPRTPRH